MAGAPMSDLVPFVVVGLVSGSLYGLAGVGLTLTYKTTGVFNFAHGAIAAAAAFVFFTLHESWRLPWPVAIIIAVGLVGLLGGMVVERISRGLAGTDPATAVVATVGLLLAIQGLISWRYGPATRELPPFLDGTAGTISGVTISAQQAAAVIIAATATMALFAFFRTARLGTEMRAVVDDPDLLGLTGANPTRVRTAAWMIGSTFAALSGVLIAPFLGLDALLLTLLVVQAFGAVAIGRFASLSLTYAGGIALGVGASILTKFVAGEPSLGGLPSSLPFLVLFLALVIWPPRRIGHAVRAHPLRTTRNLPRSATTALSVAGVVAIAAVPVVVDTRLPTYTHGAAIVVVLVSLALLVHGSGQISLCHAAFAAVGATSFAHFSSVSGLGLPWPVALVLAGLAVVPVGAIIAVPAIRLSGVYLALATFGFAILMERVAYPSGPMFGSLGLREAPRPSFAQGDTAFFYLTATIATAACLAVVLVTRTRLGRLLRGLAESPTALTTNGLSINVTRVVVFAASAFLAGIGGALLASAGGTVSGQSFGSFDSLLYLVVLAVAGRALIPSALVAAAAVAVLPAYLPDSVVEHQGLLFGVAAVFIVVGRTATVRVATARTIQRLGHSPAQARLTTTPRPAT